MNKGGNGRDEGESMKYELLADRSEHKAGTTVYRCSKPDYGLANDDCRATGEKHISVTLDKDGDYPFFTVPVSQLKEKA